MKAKLDVDVPPQVILGACNAPLAREGLQIEPDVGLLLPCNLVDRTDEQSGQTLVSSLNPEIMVSVPDRPELQPIAADARSACRTPSPLSPATELPRPRDAAMLTAAARRLR